MSIKYEDCDEYNEFICTHTFKQNEYKKYKNIDMKNKKLSKDELLELRKQHASWICVAGSLGISYITLYNIYLKPYDICRIKRCIVWPSDDDIIEMRKTKTLSDISNELNISLGAVTKRFTEIKKRKNIKNVVRAKKSLDFSCFPDIDTLLNQIFETSLLKTASYYKVTELRIKRYVASIKGESYQIPLSRGKLPDIDELLELKKSMTLQQIADKYSVTISAVYRAIERKGFEIIRLKKKRSLMDYTDQQIQEFLDKKVAAPAGIKRQRISLEARIRNLKKSR